MLLELADHLGSTSIVIDSATGELVERNSFYPYGSAESDYRPGRWKLFREDHRFTGKEEDVEVGLSYFGKRYLHPLLGRWLSPDPLALHDPASGDPNLYAYVKGALLKAVDPAGLEEKQPPQMCFLDKNRQQQADMAAERQKAKEAAAAASGPKFEVQRPAGTDMRSPSERFQEELSNVVTTGILTLLVVPLFVATNDRQQFQRMQVFNRLVTDVAKGIAPAKSSPPAGPGTGVGRAAAKGNEAVVEPWAPKWEKGMTGYPRFSGFSAPPTIIILSPGTRIDRYGPNTGRFTSPAGTPFGDRAIPAGQEQAGPNTYVVKKPLIVLAGSANAWFDQPGGGTQYELPARVRELEGMGYLEAAK